MWMKEWSLKNILCKKDKRKSIANLKATSVLRYLFSFQKNKIVLQLKKNLNQKTNIFRADKLFQLTNLINMKKSFLTGLQTD